MSQFIDFHNNPAVIGKALGAVLLGKATSICNWFKAQYEAHLNRAFELRIYQRHYHDGAKKNNASSKF